MIISTAAIILKDNKILLGKRKPGGTLGNKWEFPGGKTEQQETPEHGLKRELIEELGINIEIKDFIGEIIFKNNNKDYKLLVFYCIYLSGEIFNYEHAKISWFSPKKVKNLDLADSDRTALPIIINYISKKI